MKKPSVRWILALAGALLVASCKSSDDGTGGVGGTGGFTPGGTGGTTGGVGGTTGGTVAGTTGGVGGTTGGTVAGTGSGTGGGTPGGTGGTDGSTPGGTGGTTAGTGAAGTAASGDFTLTSSVVTDGGTLPTTYRCAASSPPLAWTAGPVGTMSYALVFKDITPGGIGEGFMHWTVYDIPTSVMSFAEGETPAAPAMQGPNWQNANMYSGPCAPFGVGTYVFTLYALPVATITVTGGDVEGAAEAAGPLATATLTIMSMP